MSTLAGVRVLDFGRYIAGPYCAALLAELGAEVIRVERVEGGEDRFVAPVTDAGDGAMFLQCNRGKLGMTLDPTRPEGREIVRRLVRTADVVVVNLPPDALAPLGLDYASLVAERPDVVLTRVTAFGTEGPYAARVGFDGIGQAMSGAMYLSGVPGAPAKSVVNYVDFTTALSAALGTLAALMDRARTGRGREVDASLLGSAIALMNGPLLEQAARAPGRVGSGNRSQNSGPSDTFTTRDGVILVQTVGQPLFARWARLIGEPQWVEDPRFATDRLRGEHGIALTERMQAWCAERTSAEALAALEQAKIPAGPVYSPAETLRDPHVRAAGFLDAVDQPGLPGPALVSRAPFRLSGEPRTPLARAPSLGEHTDAILAALGYDQTEVRELRRARVV